MTQRIPAKIQARADAIADRIREGASLQSLRAKRMKHDRTMISVPVGRHWRLMVEQTKEGLVVGALMSHGDYNGTKPGSRRRR
jgi:hypothetical protein